jgi:hypothetical protein
MGVHPLVIIMNRRTLNASDSINQGHILTIAAHLLVQRLNVATFSRMEDKSEPPFRLP